MSSHGDAIRAGRHRYAAEHGDSAAARRFGVTRASVLGWRTKFGLLTEASSQSTASERAPLVVLPVSADLGPTVCPWCETDLGTSPHGDAAFVLEVHGRLCRRNPLTAEHRAAIAVEVGKRRRTAA